MKILHVITSTGVGGAQIMLSRYLHACDPSQDSHVVISLAAGGPITGELEASGFRVYELGLNAGAGWWRATRDIRRIVRTEAPDVVFGWMYHGCLAAFFARAGLPDTALVWGIHHSLADIKAEKATSRMVIRAMAALSGRVDGLSYCSSTARAQHEAIGFAPQRARVIHNAVDAGVFRPDPGAKARLADLCAIPGTRQIIGTVARSHPMKDHVSMVRAVATLLADGRDVQGVLLGAGHSDGPAKAEAAKLGIEDRISGLENRSDVAALVPGFDAFLMSSAWGEAFPLAVAEAMAAGVPCVVTDVGDCAELVGRTGTVVPPRDVAAMAKAVDDILKLGPSDRKKLGLAGRARVAERFSFEPYIAAHDEFYRDARQHRTGTLKGSKSDGRMHLHDKRPPPSQRPEATK
jgi:glycosyltransferase involved in cell wall biosynthesis